MDLLFVGTLVLEASSGEWPLLLVLLEEWRDVEHRSFVQELRCIDDADMSSYIAFLQHHRNDPNETKIAALVREDEEIRNELTSLMSR